MDADTKNIIKVGGSVAVLMACAGWMIAAFSGTRVGSEGNNGSSLGMPTPPPTAIKMMEKMVESSDKMANQDWSDPAVRARAQMEMMKSMSGEDPEVVRQAFSEMQKQMDKMQRVLGPEQSRQMMERMQTRMPQIMDQIKKQRAADEAARSK